MPITLLIFARFLRNFTCMCDRMKNIYAQNQSTCIVLPYGKSFITELFEEPSYAGWSAEWEMWVLVSTCAYHMLVYR